MNLPDPIPVEHLHFGVDRKGRLLLLKFLSVGAEEFVIMIAPQALRQLAEAVRPDWVTPGPPPPSAQPEIHPVDWDGQAGARVALGMAYRQDEAGLTLSFAMPGELLLIFRLGIPQLRVLLRYLAEHDALIRVPPGTTRH